MSEAHQEYVHQTAEGGWGVTGTRVSLDSVIHAYWSGQSPEAIALEFPSLTLEQVYGAIAFYLREQGQIDEYLRRQDVQWSQLRAESEAQNATLLQRLRAARQAATVEPIA
jgi:uncharacterized protein (DUF433 family)